MTLFWQISFAFEKKAVTLRCFIAPLRLRMRTSEIDMSKKILSDMTTKMSTNIEKYNQTPLAEQFVADIRQIITMARTNAVRSVDFCRVQMYWNLGKRILEEEQQGKARADYGTYLIRNLAKEIEPEYGSGFGERQLKFCRQFYREYPIVNTLRSQLNWSQYRMLIQIPDHDKREYYELEAVNNAWTGRELQRQIDSMLYERLLMSNDKEAVLAVARNEKLPEENPTIGILLCSRKNDTLVRTTLPENNTTILASEYQLYLPTEEQLINEIDEVKSNFNKDK